MVCGSCQTHPQLHEAGGRGAAEGKPPCWLRQPKAASLYGWVCQVFKHQAACKHEASTSKHQATSIKKLGSQTLVHRKIIGNHKKLENNHRKMIAFPSFLIYFGYLLIN